MLEGEEVRKVTVFVVGGSGVFSSKEKIVETFLIVAKNHGYDGIEIRLASGGNFPLEELAMIKDGKDVERWDPVLIQEAIVDQLPWGLH